MTADWRRGQARILFFSVTDARFRIERTIGDVSEAVALADGTRVAIKALRVGDGDGGGAASTTGHVSQEALQRWLP